MIADHDALVALLAPASGVERSKTVIVEECARLGVPYPPTGPALERVVDALSMRSGAIGTSIRLAFRRATKELNASPPPHGGPEPKPTPDLIALLAPVLGDDKAQSVVRDACARLGLGASSLSTTDSRRVLDLLSAGGDFVATIARFAKARTLLSG